jgi:hypothetical protein
MGRGTWFPTLFMMCGGLLRTSCAGPIRILRVEAKNDEPAALFDELGPWATIGHVGKLREHGAGPGAPSRLRRARASTSCRVCKTLHRHANTNVYFSLRTFLAMLEPTKQNRKYLVNVCVQLRKISPQFCVEI